MTIYLIIEYNGMTYDDARFDPIKAYINKEQAERACQIFNESRNGEPEILPKEEWKPECEEDTYEDYLEEVRLDWNWYGKRMSWSIQEIELI